MNVNFDAYGRIDTPPITLMNPTGEELGSLNNALDINVSLNFNTLSEIQMRVPQTIPCYGLVTMLRYIKVEGLGQFVIVQCGEEGDGVTKYKNVVASSIERELVGK
ncbi:MAG: hypothetical protein ACRDD8_01995, partial [Bacteroidales bacterium]